MYLDFTSIFLNSFFHSFFSVDEELNVKIADNALSRDFFPGDYHCLGDNENRPVRWMATECLECSEYSPASDVVSFEISVFLSVGPVSVISKKASKDNWEAVEQNTLIPYNAYGIDLGSMINMPK